MSESSSDATLPDDPGVRSTEECPVDLAHVIGVGASAGGLEALEQFFGSMPSDTGSAFVVVQHLSPDFKSHMEQLLSRHTTMEIHRVEDGMVVEPNHVYLIPPRKVMIISEGKLLLTEKDPDSGLSLPIDQFFRSLAVEVGRLSVGVVLSGTGSDGSRGIEDIREAGGLVIVQDPTTAAFDGMPQSALKTGYAHLSLPPAAMAQALESYVGDGLLPDALSDVAESFDGGVFDPIVDLLQSVYRIDFGHYKPTTVGRRIRRRMEFSGTTDVGAYLESLEDDRGELNELYRDLLIGVTRFLRDEDAFQVLERSVLPELVRRKKKGSSIRVWAPGCATGEEAYSLAMILDELIRRMDRDLDVKIFATDVHQASLNVATRGIYPAEALDRISEERKQEYFERLDGEYQVRSKLRKMIVFAEHDVLSQPPFTQQDMVVCRNLLIYFQSTPQRRVLSLFHFALRTDGILFLGPSETVGDLDDEFETIDKKWRIFRKRRDVRLPLEQRLAITPSLAAATGSIKPVRPHTGVDERLRATNEIYGRVLEEHMPPSAVVTSDFELLHMFGGFNRLLSMRGLQPTSQLLELLPDDLRTTVSGALTHALRENASVRYSGVVIQGNDGPEVRTLVCEPLGETRTPTKTLLIKLIVPSSPKASDSVDPGTDEITADINEATLNHIRALEQDLGYARENLQATVEELETSNEELQATNEELVAGNEELQSTNEELQSVNEELFTVNVEHQKKIEELTQANDDMDNLLATTEVGVFFLDDKLRLRRFTPVLSERLDLLPQDIGTSIERLAYALGFPELEKEMRRAFETTGRLERELEVKDGTPSFLRVLPYRTREGAEGVVGSLINIAGLRRAEAEIARFKFICDQSPDALSMVDEAGVLTYVNDAFCDTVGLDKEGALTLEISKVDPNWDLATHRKRFVEAHEKGAQTFETENVKRGGARVPVEVTVSPFVFEGEKVLFVQARDITARRAAERRLAFEHKISRIAATATNLGQAAKDFLRPFVDVLGMDAAEFWRFEGSGASDDDSHNLQRQSQVIHDGFPEAELWRQATDQTSVVRGIGLLGRAWQSGTATWADDVPSIHGFDRTDSAERADLSTGCAFPIVDGEAVIGIVAFFARDRYPDPPALLESLAALGRTIGQTCNRLETERALQLRDRAVDATYDGIVIADARADDFPLIYVNSGFERITGYTAEEALDRNCRFLQGSESDQSVVEDLRKALTERRPIRATIANYRKNGERFWNELQISPVSTDDGEVDHFVAVQHDITERVRIEDELKSAEQRATAANAAKSRFLANMSHEIRTPMAAILGFADVLRKEVKDEAAKGHVDVIKRNGRYLLQLINDILDLSKVEAGQMEVEKKATDLPALLADVEELMAVRTEGSDVNLSFESRGRLPLLVQTDAIRLRQILVNLISNAIKFTREGDVWVEASIENVGGDGGGGEPTTPALKIAVRDTGVGIDAADQARVFEPFTQARDHDQGILGEQGGTGLGLSITRRLVEALGGSIELASEVGVGSTFTILLPTGSLENTTFVDWDGGLSGTGPKDQSDQAFEGDLEGRYILVADDRKDVGDAARFYLEDGGAEVCVVGNGKAAIGAVEENERQGRSFDVIFMDMQMPVMDGFEATRRLRERGYDGLIVALTAGAMAEEAAHCLEAGCDLFLAKPVEEDVLIRTARSVRQKDRS